MKTSLKLIEKDKTQKSHEVLNFEAGVTIQCGGSSITLTPEGDIILTGKRLVQTLDEDVTLKAPIIQLNPK